MRITKKDEKMEVRSGGYDLKGLITRHSGDDRVPYERWVRWFQGIVRIRNQIEFEILDRFQNVIYVQQQREEQKVATHLSYPLGNKRDRPSRHDSIDNKQLEFLSHFEQTLINFKR